jgi:ABC-type polysaccharide/polyol phosphate transport system ATPase subunit
MKNSAIQLTNVSKKYILHHEKPTLTESFFKKREEFWALKNINLNINKGDKLGIIGLNGSGKSTLLKIITQITIPTMGRVKTLGKIASLIDLEAGFEPDLTGEENVFLNGLLMGMPKQLIQTNFQKIINFSGISKFIDSPLHTYSSGMKLRLGFSIAIHSNPDLLILDEILAAGDEEFRKKSYTKMQEFFKQDKTIVFVSHDLASIKALCPRTLWLERGKIRALGKTREIISSYLKTAN